MSDYTVAEGRDLAELIVNVKALKDVGWIAQGGVQRAIGGSVSGQVFDGYIQAMIKP